MSDFVASIKINFNKRYPGIHHAIVKHTIAHLSSPWSSSLHLSFDISN